MPTVDVAVEASDAFSEAGLAGLLRPAPGLRIVARRRLGDGGVLVAALDRFSARELDRLRSAAPVPTVVVTDVVAETMASTPAAGGVVAVLSRTGVSTQRLVSAVLGAAGGAGNLESPAVIVDRHVSPDAPVTSRERTVLRLLADGLDTPGIAARLSYSERTVKNVIYELTRKLNLRSRAHAVAYALRAGLI
ncbi:DNA-binding response regulator [Prauserella sp. ASG 168]|uniref:DNA-binding response regulator n=2 Tax=Prauserella cavernicola TaxID=2800127 RepID=A0A934V964_9PSEU|nr:DNA-binding response regulator [Prauserella cavernicola]